MLLLIGNPTRLRYFFVKIAKKVNKKSQNIENLDNGDECIVLVF